MWIWWYVPIFPYITRHNLILSGTLNILSFGILRFFVWVWNSSMQMIRSISCSFYIFYVIYVSFIFSIGVLPYDDAYFISIVLLCFFGKACVCLWPLLSSLSTSSLVGKETIDLVAYLSSSESNKSKFSNFSSWLMQVKDTWSCNFFCFVTVRKKSYVCPYNKSFLIWFLCKNVA